MTGANAAENGAEAVLEQLESQGVDCIFASPIAVRVALAANLQTRSAVWHEADERWTRYMNGVRAKGIEEARQLVAQATDFVSAASLFCAWHDAPPEAEAYGGTGERVQKSDELRGIAARTRSRRVRTNVLAGRRRQPVGAK